MKGFEEFGEILCKRKQGESRRRKVVREDFMKGFEELGGFCAKGDKGRAGGEKELWRIL